MVGDAAHRAEHGIDRDAVDAVFGGVLVGGDVAFAFFDAHFHDEFAVLGEVGDDQIGVDDLGVAGHLEGAGLHFTLALGTQGQGFGAGGVEFHDQFLEVQDQTDHVFLHARNGAELV